MLVKDDGSLEEEQSHSVVTSETVLQDLFMGVNPSHTDPLDLATGVFQPHKDSCVCWVPKNIRERVEIILLLDRCEATKYR